MSSTCLKVKSTPLKRSRVVAHNIGIAIYEAKITSIEDRLKGYSKPPLLGIEPPIPSYKRSLMTAFARDWTADTSGQVINLNINTAFKCIPHILGSLQLLQTVAELYAYAHYYFAHSFNSPSGSKVSSMCPVRRALTPWATRVGLKVRAVTSSNLIFRHLTSQNWSDRAGWFQLLSLSQTGWHHKLAKPGSEGVFSQLVPPEIATLWPGLLLNCWQASHVTKWLSLTTWLS